MESYGSIEMPTNKIKDGPNKTDCPQIERRPCTTQGVGNQGCSHVSRFHRWSKETPQVPPWHRRSPSNPTLPKVYRAFDPQAPLPALGQRASAGAQDRVALPISCHPCFARSGRIIPGGAVRRLKPVRHPRKEGYNHAQGHGAGAPDPRGADSVRYF